MEYFFQTHERLYFVLPYIRGGDLFMHLKNEVEGFDENRIRFYATQIVLGLAILHEHGIMHRDLKLENLMLCEDGYIKMIDFGLSQFLEEGQLAHKSAGTREYMAPEMFKEPVE